MQSLRRLEAKRRRSEKQRVRGGEEERRESDVSLRGRGGQRQLYVDAMNKVGSSVAPQFGLPSWAVAAKQTILGGGIEGLIARGKGNSGGSGLESMRGCSSSMSELESSKALQGINFHSLLCQVNKFPEIIRCYIETLIYIYHACVLV